MQGLDADVIIVGAGPAGSIAAYVIAAAGYSVLVLEKESFPRYKVCGGGLTHKILKEIPYDIESVIQTKIFSVRFSCRFEEVFTQTSADPLMYCTMRPELDQFMLNKALEAGAKVLFDSHVREIRKEDDNYTVRTDGSSFSGRIIIGADGASGITARASGLKENIEKGLAWEAEISASQSKYEEFRTTVFLDWGTFPGGYGWIFPKKDHFSVGVGGPASLSGRMPEYYIEFLRSTGFFSVPDDIKDPALIPGTISLKAWPIPVKTKKGNFHSGEIMVTGDAAGLSDPLTGEGIYYAVRSGKLAGEAAVKYLEGNSSAFKEYSENVNAELMTELIEAYRIRHIFNAFPLKVHHFVRDSERGWRAFGKVLRGERWYVDVRNGFGRWKKAWTIVSSISAVAEKIKEKRFRKKGFRRRVAS